MPSPFGIACVLLFWLATTGLVVYRDVWPRYFSSGPPPIAIDVADEAGQLVPVRWLILRGNKKVGSLTTEMKYVPADDTFRFIHTYRQVSIELMGVEVSTQELIETTRVTRSGDLRGQSLDGRIDAAIRSGGLNLVLSARVKIRGRVEDGQLVGRVEVIAPGFGTLDAPLEPVAVPAGRVLNPLQPVNRLVNVRPGLRWVVPEINPLRDAIAAMTKQKVALPGKRTETLIAEVASEPRNLLFKGELVPCWVIDYRDEQPVARTWVRASDGKVLRQEAFGMGEHLVLQRDE